MNLKNKNGNYIPALGYHWLTPFYDWVMGAAGGHHYMSTLIEQARFEHGHRVLDVACGTGTLAILIKRKYSAIDMIALDCDEQMLSRGEQKAVLMNAGLQFDLAFAEKLPYPDSCFDRVVSSLFFHHLIWENKMRVAGEILRVLKPGGELHVMDWGHARNWLMRVLFLPVQWLDGIDNTRDNVSGRLIELFELAGFSDVTQQRSFNTIFGTLALYSAQKSSGTRS